MSRSLDLLILSIVALSAVQSSVANTFRENRALTTTVTVTAATASTTVISTKFTCAVLVAPVATTACRRKRQYWGVPLVYAYGQSELHQFDSNGLTQVSGVQPSAVPEYRDQPVPFADPYGYISPFGIQSSMEGTAATADGVAPVETMFRIADPFFFAPLSSLVASLVSNILTPPVTVTSTQTVYTTTVTQKVFTTTATYQLTSIPCLPVQMNVCPAAPLAAVGVSAPLLAAAPVVAAPSASTTAAATTSAAATAATTTAGTTPVAATTAATTTAATTTATATTAATTTEATTTAAATTTVTTAAAAATAATTTAATTTAATTTAATTTADTTTAAATTAATTTAAAATP